MTRNPTACINCGELIRLGPYCENCGQRMVHGRLDFWTLVNDFREQLFELNLPWLYTIKALTVRPGKVCRDFVASKRICYVNPLKYFIYVSALATFLSQYIPLQYRSIQVPVQGALYRDFNPFQRFINDNPIVMSLFAGLLTTFFIRVLDRRTPYNKTEINSAILFILGHIVILIFTGQLLAILVVGGVREFSPGNDQLIFTALISMSMVIALLVWGYCVTAYHRFFQTGPVSAALKATVLLLIFALIRALTRQTLLFYL